jgi:hypothetical protein
VSDLTVTPPATADWDYEDVAAKALAILRLDGTDIDAGRVSDQAVVACGQVDHDVDKLAAAPPSPAMIDSAVATTIALYRRKDAPFGQADAWSLDTLAADVPDSPLAGVRGELLPDRERWGLA